MHFPELLLTFGGLKYKLFESIIINMLNHVKEWLSVFIINEAGGRVYNYS